jgi:hypothetical protein
VRGVIDTVQISHPGRADEGVDYWVDGDGGRLAGLYGDFLGLHLIDIGYKKLVHDDERLPVIGFEYSPDDARPGWRDPERPQQMHLDIVVGDLELAEEIAQRWGATRLQDMGHFRTYADAIGHPFCVYVDPDSSEQAPGRIARIVIDCPDPAALAAFYEEFLDMRVRIMDTPERVEISGDPAGIVLAFQRAQFAPAAWPDPAHPAQLHLDLTFDDVATAGALAEQLGATRLSVGDFHSVYGDPASHPFCLVT